MRTNLKLFRIRNHMTQAEIADRIKCNRTTYSDIEGGKRNARGEFWTELQKEFNIPDKDMWALTKNE